MGSILYRPTLVNARTCPNESAAFAPDDVSGLTLWLDANVIGTLWQDSARTTQVSADGDPVGAHDDSSGVGNNFSQSTSGARPTYQTAELNSLPVIRFDGVDDRLAKTSGNSSAIITNSARTVFIVFKAASGGPSSGYNDDLLLGDNGGWWWISISGSGTTVNVGHQNGTDGVKQVAPSISTGTWYILESRHESGTLYAALNGGSASSVAVGVVGSLTDGAPRTGANYSGAYLDADVAEILVYNVAVSSGDRSSILSYLNTKWSVY